MHSLLCCGKIACEILYPLGERLQNMRVERHLWNIKYLVCILSFIGSISDAMISAASTFYVATTGNDAVSCTTAQNSVTPKLTISNAMRCLGAGDTLFIRGGKYDEGISIPDTLPGTVSQPIVIAGY